MAGGPVVTLIFDADTKKLKAGVDRASSSFNTLVGRMGKIGGAAAGITGLTNTVLTLGAATATLAPALLTLPGILAGVGVAGGVAKLALNDFTKAVEGDAKALAKFSPAGQAAAKAVTGLGDGFKKMRSAVQEKFFADLAEPIKTVGGHLLELGEAKLPAVATGFNSIAKEALAAADTDFFKGSVGKVIDDTAAGMGNMKMSLANVTTGFAGLATVGSAYLPQIGAAIDGVAARFNTWVQEGLKTGEIQAMVDRAIQGFRTLGEFLALMGQGIATVFRTIGEGMGAAATPLDVLRDKAQLFVDIVNSPTAQQAFLLIGQAIRAVSDAFSAVMPHLAGFVFWISGMILPAVIAFAGWVTENGQLFAGIIIGIVAFIGAIKLLLTIITVVRTAMMIWAAAQVAWGVVMGLSLLPILAVVAAVAALIAIGYLLIANWDTIKAAAIAAWTAISTAVSTAVTGVVSFVSGAWESVKSGASSAWSTVTSTVSSAWSSITSAVSSGGASVLSTLSSAWEATKRVVSDAWQAHVRFVASGVQQVVSFVGTLPGKIRGVLSGLGGLLVSSGQALVDGFRRGIASAWSGLVSWFQSQLAWFRGLWPFSPAKWGPFSGTGYVTYSGEALVGDFANSLRSGMPGVGAAAQDVMGAAARPLGATPTGGWSPTAAPSGGGGSRTVTFTGNTSDALATVIMQMIRTGKIQIA